MKITKYEKLIRDCIPKIIESNGKEGVFNELDDAQYLEELKNKLIEESLEVQKAITRTELVEELADVLEVFEALQKALQIDTNEIEIIKNKKAKKNGRFEKKLFLQSVIEDE